MDPNSATPLAQRLLQDLDHAKITVGGDLPEYIRTYYQPRGGDNDASQDVYRTHDGFWELVVAWVVFSALLGWSLSIPVWWRWRKLRGRPTVTEGDETAQPPSPISEQHHPTSPTGT